MLTFRLTGIALLVLQPWQAARPASDDGDIPQSEPFLQSESPIYYTYRIVHAWPHDPGAFTQGLLFRNGSLLESTGLYGKSSLREVVLETGQVVRSIPVPAQYFAEGLAVIGSRIYQLTWQGHKGFVYDVDSFANEGEFGYRGEGWGLTSDGHLLILSDGTDRIRFLDPDSYQVVREIRVSLAGHTLPMLNELEWIRGDIFANVWQTDDVVRIDPKSGNVTGMVDLYGLLPSGDRTVDTDVLNGVAYDAVRNRLFVTGKRWPKIFEVRLVRK